MSEERDQVTAEADDVDRPAAAADDIEKLSTRELHDRAMHRAETHLDAKFFWSLLEIIPAAEVAAVGDTGRADFDILHSRSQIRDALHSGEGPLAESLRPVFVDYLRKHPSA